MSRLLSVAARVAVRTAQQDSLPADAPPNVVSQQQQEGQQEQVSYIKHEKGKGYCVKSPKNKDWSGGCYPSKGEAEKRLNQVEMFKHMKKGAITPDDIAYDLKLVAARLAASKNPDLATVLSDLRSILGAFDPETEESKKAEHQHRADWEMTLKDPEGDEKIEIGPSHQQQGQQQQGQQEETAVSPPGWGGPVEHMEKDPSIKSPEALAWYMKNKGDKPHVKPKHHHKGDE